MDKKIDKKEVTYLYYSGMNMRQIGEALGVSNSDICQFMIKHNINRSCPSGYKVRESKRVKLNEEKKEQVASMYDSGMNQSKIGNVLRVSQTWISVLMKRYDIKVRKTGLGRPKKGGIKNE